MTDVTVNWPRLVGDLSAALPQLRAIDDRANIAAAAMIEGGVAALHGLTTDAAFEEVLKSMGAIAAYVFHERNDVDPKLLDFFEHVNLGYHEWLSVDDDNQR